MGEDERVGWGVGHGLALYSVLDDEGDADGGDDNHQEADAVEGDAERCHVCLVDGIAPIIPAGR